MRICETGRSDAPVVLLLQNAAQDRETESSSLRELEGRFCVVRSVLTASDTEPDTVRTLTGYLNRKYHGNLYAICSTEHAWRLTRALLATRSVNAERLVVEADGGKAGSLTTDILLHEF